MKKIAIVLFVVSSALAACGKKKPPEAPATTPAAGSDMGSDMGSAATEPAGSAEAPAGEGSAAM